MKVFLLFIYLFIVFSAFSQEIDTLDSVTNISLVAFDSLGYTPLDSTHVTDSIPFFKKRKRKNDIETTINYHAKDSLYFDVKSQNLFLYGDSHIDYGKIALDAEKIDVNWKKRRLKTRYVTDSTGKKIGKPIFKEGPEVYVTDDIIYNFKTEQAHIKGVITEKEGGYMHGEDVKKNMNDELFVNRAEYTTCNLEHPHFSIQATELKVIPNDKVISGPFNLKFRNLPTPIFFPFGLFPQPNKKSSGIVFPSYGEEQRRGFFLRNGGYYFAINDNIDLRITGDIYSKGSNAIQAVSNYYKRYSFRGTFNFSYVNSVSDNIENPLQTNDYNLRWNHTPETKGNSSFSASVNIATRSYTENNNLVVQDFNRSINARLTSSINYRKTFSRTPFRLSSSIRYNQNLSTGIVNLTLPDVTITMNRIYPFKKIVKSSNSLLAKLNFSHNFVAKFEVSNAAVREPSFNVINRNPISSSTINFNTSNLDELLSRSQIGGKHTIPISTSLSVLKYFTLSPRFNYEELWYSKELHYEYVPEENGVRIDTVNGFSRAGSWSTGMSLNTRVYGTIFFKKGQIQAIRHVMTPSLSYSYSPDFSSTKYGVYSDVQINEEGDIRRLSKFEGFIYGSPTGQERQTIGFSLSNNIEMKVASKKDTINGVKKIKVFENIGLSTGYNIVADSFNLSNISINARTSFFNGKLALNFSGTIDPYEYLLISESINSSGQRSVSQRRINRFAWNNGNGLGRLSNMMTSISLNFKGGNKGKSNKNDLVNDIQNGGPPLQGNEVEFGGYTSHEKQQIEHIQNNPEEYVDFDVPWSLRIQYSLNRTKTGFQDPTIRQSAQFSGSLGLTDKTQITFNSGYDFQSKEITSTRIGINRDLHCWTMSLDWVPFGRFQSYFFSIRVKSAVLQDLKYDKRRSFLDFFN